MTIITFTNTFDIALDGREPLPSSKFIPDWYKKTASYINGEKKPTGDGSGSGTIKRCMPVFDAITSGYIIPTYVDLFVSKMEDGNIKVEAPSMDPLGFHPLVQAPFLPGVTDKTVQFPKWINPWGIETPKGYSCLFIAPMHHPNEFFKVLPGVVDTDQYTAPVNFPFMFTDPDFVGLIPAGTPMVQVIPFKREAWQMKMGSVKEINKINSIKQNLRSIFFDSYKIKYRANKEYK
jgi:hypothetical protein